MSPTWCPPTSLTCALTSFCFLSEPNNESPLNVAAAELWGNQEGENLTGKSNRAEVSRMF